jgi:hypothetical protein
MAVNKQTAGPSTVRRKKSGKMSPQARKRQERLFVIGIVVIFVAIFALVIVVSYLQDRPVGDEREVPSLGNTHVETGQPSPIQYNSVPPTSGPHYGNLVEWGTYDEALPYELVLHNMEDGGVVVYYQCEDGCPELVEQLTEIVEPAVEAGQRVVMMPNDPTAESDSGRLIHEDMGSRIALTAWGRIDTFEEFEAERVRGFINRYQGIDHH